MKSMNMKSMTGRVPVIAAPQASPTKPRSQIGVSQRRSAPYLANRPVVVAKLPPRAPMPSPMTKMPGWQAISVSNTSERGGSKSDLPVSWDWFGNLQRRGLFAVDKPGRGAAVRQRSLFSCLRCGGHLCLNLRIERIEFLGGYNSI